MQKQSKTTWVIQGAVVAALYVVLTELVNLLGLASGAVQVRLSEALNVLAVFTSAAVPGLTIGCLLANLLTGCVVWDVVFGSVATLLGALGTYYFRKHRVIALLCPIVSNTVIVPFVLRYAYGAPDAFWYMFLTVGAGEIISCGVFGYLLGMVTDRYKKILFKN